MNSGDIAAVTIDRVGAEGDGIALAPDGATLYIPDALPGELVRAEKLRRQGGGWYVPHTGVLRASEARVPPSCTHFGACGGCVLQHWRDAEYRAWKTGLLDAALRRAGFADPRIEPIQVTPGQSRRRMDLAARRTPRGVVVGLHARIPSSANWERVPHPADTICDLTECQVLHPALFALIAPLRPLLTRLQSLHREASVIANLLDHGADLLLRTDAPLNRSDRERLIGFARTHRLLRLSTAPLHGEAEPVVVLQPPRITLSGVTVEPPPGAFLQASRDGETAIVQAVLAGLPEKPPARARVGELYAGSGSITLALAQRVRVAAWEGDAAAAAALRQAVNRSGLAGRVTVAQRDLARQPVPAGELAGFAAVVLDPPFAGAAVQMAPIAAAKSARVIYVSCNPAVLARDARVLHEAGYALQVATPVDQFLWSARLESVCVFVRT
ncbi:MAG TPA: RsmD family RNA methyltransferase [Acetobacteraceae bacterium]|nr:RsmD family RNA methyltransferase [Acetobacteraceae bacterium]